MRRNQLRVKWGFGKGKKDEMSAAFTANELLYNVKVSVSIKAYVKCDASCVISFTASSSSPAV